MWSALLPTTENRAGAHLALSPAQVVLRNCAVWGAEHFRTCALIVYKDLWRRIEQHTVRIHVVPGNPEAHSGVARRRPTRHAACACSTCDTWSLPTWSPRYFDLSAVCIPRRCGVGWSRTAAHCSATIRVVGRIYDLRRLRNKPFPDAQGARAHQEQGLKERQHVRRPCPYRP